MEILKDNRLQRVRFTALQETPQNSWKGLLLLGIFWNIFNSVCYFTYVQTTCSVDTFHTNVKSFWLLKPPYFHSSFRHIFKKLWKIFIFISSKITLSGCAKLYGFKKSQIVFYYKFDPFPPSQGIDPDFKFMENLRVRYREESAGSKFCLKSYLYLGLFFILL